MASLDSSVISDLWNCRQRITNVFRTVVYSSSSSSSSSSGGCGSSGGGGGC